MINRVNVFKFNSAFKVLHTTERSQTAVMTLDPGESSSEMPNTHPASDQVLVVLEGELLAEIDFKSGVLHKGDTVTVTAGVAHKFTNSAQERAITFNVYAPPAYDSGG
jgi:mannose-6-phosphate isomerase-like protein (cupin superfamily)